MALWKVFTKVFCCLFWCCQDLGVPEAGKRLRSVCSFQELIQDDPGYFDFYGVDIFSQTKQKSVHSRWAASVAHLGSLQDPRSTTPFFVKLPWGVSFSWSGLQDCWCPSHQSLHEREKCTADVKGRPQKKTGHAFQILFSQTGVPTVGNKARREQEITLPMQKNIWTEAPSPTAKDGKIRSQKTQKKGGGWKTNT